MPKLEEMDGISLDEFSRRLEVAAVRFASDYGPLSAALSGDPKARAKVADKLSDCLMQNGLTLNPS